MRESGVGGLLWKNTKEQDLGIPSAVVGQALRRIGQTVASWRTSSLNTDLQLVAAVWLHELHITRNLGLYAKSPTLKNVNSS